MPSPARLAATTLPGLAALLAALALAPAAHADAFGPLRTADATYADPIGDDYADPIGDEDEGEDAGDDKPAPRVFVKGRTVKGKVAQFRTDGTAAIPLGAPKRVRLAIAAANKLVGRKSLKGVKGKAGSKAFTAKALSDVMIAARLFKAAKPIGYYAKFGEPGRGRWATVYAGKSHAYLEIAGLRLDTSTVGDPDGLSGLRWRPTVGRLQGFRPRHPVGL